jgi:hypothetical protein
LAAANIKHHPVIIRKATKQSNTSTTSTIKMDMNWVVWLLYFFWQPFSLWSPAHMMAHLTALTSNAQPCNLLLTPRASWMLKMVNVMYEEMLTSKIYNTAKSWKPLNIRYMLLIVPCCIGKFCSADGYWHVWIFIYLLQFLHNQ